MPKLINEVAIYGARITRDVVRENLTPECVYRRKGYRGNRAGRRMLSLCFRPYNHPNGAHAGWKPVSEAWKSFAKRRPVDAEFYASDMMRRIIQAAKCGFQRDVVA